MALRIKKHGTGYRPYWYATYKDHGIQKEIKLDVEIKGRPPASLSVKDSGDAKFEASRGKAQACFEEFMKDRKKEGATSALVAKVIEMRGGNSLEFVKLQNLAEKYLSIGRTRSISKGRINEVKHVIARFSKFIKKEYLYDINTEDVGRYFTNLQKAYAWSTVLTHMSILTSCFERFLPEGMKNPFKEIIKHNTSSESACISKIALTKDELNTIRKHASTDPFLYPLVECAICTGARLKDIVYLEWMNIDLENNLISFNAAKTGTQCTLPIFPPLRAVLDRLHHDRALGEIYVFPEAHAMYEHNRSGLVWRGKKLFANSLYSDNAKPTYTTLPREMTISEILDAIDAQGYAPDKREKLKDLYTRYAIEKQSYRTISAQTGRSRSDISFLLKNLENDLGTRIIRFDPSKGSLRTRMMQTREYRLGKRGVSVLGWHAFRTTFCTTAIENGVDERLIIKAVGHSTFKMLRKHYDRAHADYMQSQWGKCFDSFSSGISQPMLIDKQEKVQTRIPSCQTTDCA